MRTAQRARRVCACEAYASAVAHGCEGRTSNSEIPPHRTRDEQAPASLKTDAVERSFALAVRVERGTL